MASRLYACLFVFLLSGLSHARDYFKSNGQGVAIGGYDPVAYFALKKAILGTGAHQTDRQGVTWHFSSKKYKEMFRSDPERFAPKFGGWCAMAIIEGQVTEVDFDNGWTVDATGLYFNDNKDVRLRWLRGYNRKVGKGNESWPATRLAERLNKGVCQFTVGHRCQITITSSKSPEKALMEQVVNDFLHQTIFAGRVIA